MEILPDVPIEIQLAIHAEVMKVAEQHNLPFGKAFYILMQRYKQALVVSELERISVEEAISKLSQIGYWESLRG
ncbi:hypothetical protein [Chroococcidiopsis sp.]|uniref:hypothetical protein n=1 Tax=Chroococcidiopsis sp. TaxID=3088168 RepID=UPI003F2EC403